MGIFENNFLLRFAKRILKTTLYRSGTTATILRGPLQGYKYRVNENSGWAPIYGGLEPEAQKIFEELVKPGNIVYDLGANTGIHSLLFSKLVGAAGKVFCFEPIPENMREIEFVRDLNHITNLYLFPKAVGNRKYTGFFSISKNNKEAGLSGCTGEAIGAIHVEVTTLDSEIAGGIAFPDFIKIDVEGDEYEALEGFSQSIKKCHPVFSVELHTPEQDRNVGRFFKEQGYRLYRLKDPRIKRLRNQKSLLVNVTNLDAGWPEPGGVWGTVIAIPPQKELTSGFLKHIGGSGKPKLGRCLFGYL